MVNYTFNVSEPWFSLISLGIKSVEGRLNKGKFNEIQVGDTIEWNNDIFMHRSIKTKVVGKRYYKNFKEYLSNEGLERCLPAIPSIEHVLSVYYTYYSKEDEHKYGVAAIEVKVEKEKGKSIEGTRRLFIS